MKKFETLEEAQAAFDKLAEELESAKKDGAEMYKEVNQLRADNNELSDIIGSLRKEKTSAPSPKTFTLDKKEYVVKAGKFRYHGKDYTAEDLVKNKDLQRALIEAKSGVVEPVK